MKAPDVLGDHLSMIFERKVSRFKDVEVDVFQILPIRVSADRRKDNVVFTPNDQCRRLMTPEIVLPFRIGGRC